jgi:hypothetical protein
VFELEWMKISRAPGQVYQAKKRFPKLSVDGANIQAIQVKLEKAAR